MSIRAVRSLPEILDCVQDARVRALRWDVVPNALVLDVDCALETKHVDEVLTVKVCRGWLVVENARDLAIHINWNKFREGFSLVDLQERQPEGRGDLREYCFETDFPEGKLTIAGTRIILLRSVDALEVRDFELPMAQRNSLASDSELLLFLSRGDWGHSDM